MDFKRFWNRIEELSQQRRAQIAFGLAEPTPSVLESLKRCQAFVDITLVGPPAIAGQINFPLIIDEQPEERLAGLLARDEVEGLVYGTLDDFKTREAYERLAGEQASVVICLMRDPIGRHFFVGPASNPEGWTKEERLALALAHATFMADWDLQPDIAVFTGIRHGTYKRKRDQRQGVLGTLLQTYEDAEWIVEQLRQRGFKATNWTIELNVALDAGANLLIPVNGLVGNQVFRAVQMGSGRVVLTPQLGFSRCYETCSRNEKDFFTHLQWLAAWINRSRPKK